MTTLLTCDRLTKQFGGIVALDGFDAEFAGGEITGIVGPNGAGKTTLFDVVTGVHAPDEGVVEFRGETITGRPPHRVCRAGIARTFQTPKPIRTLSVEENLQVASRFGAGADPDPTPDPVSDPDSHPNSDHDPDPVPNPDPNATGERHQRVLDVFGLTGRRGDDPGDLQLVEQKYVDLARALMTDPELVLLDEMLAGLPPTEKDEVVATLREIHADFGVDFLVVEHDLGAIRSLSDTVIAMDDGRFLARGTPDEVLADDRVKEAYVGT